MYKIVIGLILLSDTFRFRVFNICKAVKIFLRYFLLSDSIIKFPTWIGIYRRIGDKICKWTPSTLTNRITRSKEKSVCALLVILFHPQKAFTSTENLAFINLYGITALRSQLHSHHPFKTQEFQILVCTWSLWWLVHSHSQLSSFSYGSKGWGCKHYSLSNAGAMKSSQGCVKNAT